ncbi:beta-mannosidase-like [Agrilus planipennis]|uniref:beta-mannosidase n=1 Tax=Agrilus planipennis TaxID=224129 RepID=A0A7F5RBS9_AGRPL|nr:beta-mannosidase-like [Agrilus planipennis]
MDRMAVLLIVSCLCFLSGLVSTVLIQNLDGNWKLKDAEKPFSLEATVPGGIYTDLMNNKILDDVFFDENDQQSRWVSLRNWVYTKIFTVNLRKPVYLEAFNSTNIRYVTTSTLSSGDYWILEVTTYISGNVQGNVDGNLIYSLKTEQDVYEIIYPVSLNFPNGGDLFYTGQISIPKINVNNWWPNGFGNQSLYTLNVTFVGSDGKETAEKIIRIGFRTIELVQDSLQVDNGTTFYFKVNDIPIFMKGTNLIPVNILPELGQNEAQIRYLLNSAKDVHMNMIRVWGGGVYESDTLYDVADELGIIIWQDFMFACSMYPTNDKFLTTVRKEVRHQVRRLQHHASIGLWAGNNENELALRTNWYGTNNEDRYFKDYVTLYVDLIKKECLANDKTRPFLTSSPTNGIESDKEDYVARNPSSTHYGDVHYYNYVLDSWDVTIYPKPRFASEYGYQSLPSLKTWLTAVKDVESLNLTSDFMDSRQHHPDGYMEILMLINDRLSSPGRNLEAMMYYSQILQAMAVKIETENYRRMKSVTFDNGEGLTMGALYWQLNDVWVAPTWSSIDFKNRWKMLHYFAKDFFAPVIVTGIQMAGSLEIYTVSDLLTTRPNVSVTLHIDVELLYQENVNIVFDGVDTFATVYFNDIKIGETDNMFVQYIFDVKEYVKESGKSELVKSLSIPEFLSQKGCGNETFSLLNCFFYLGVEDDNGAISPKNFVFPTPLRKVKAGNPKLTIASVKLFAKNVFEVTVNSDKVALFVWLETGDIFGRFSENGFLQIAPTKSVYFYPESNVTLHDLKSVVKVTSLFDKKWALSSNKLNDDNVKVITKNN